MAREAQRVQQWFDDADLPVLFLKGTALGVLAFGNLGLRSGQDIDVLTASETRPEAMSLILRAGYRRFDSPPEISDARLRMVMALRKDLGFVDQASGLPIELHWRLFPNPHGMAGGSTMAASRLVPLAGAAGLRTMSEEDLCGAKIGSARRGKVPFSAICKKSH
jgi:hypothetical protein